MTRSPRIGARIATALLLPLTFAIGQQGPRAEAEAHLRAGRFAAALAAADAALQADPESHDWHFVRAEALARLGQPTDAATSRDHMVRLHEQRLRQLARSLELGAGNALPVAGAAAAPTTGTNGTTTSPDPAAMRQALAAAPRTDDVLAVERRLDRAPAPGGKAPAKPDAALSSALTKVATDANRQAKAGDKDASKRLAEVVLAAAGEQPRSSAAAVNELANSTDPEIADAALRQLRALFDLAIAQAIAAFAAGDDDTGDHYVAESSRIGDMLLDRHDRGLVLDGSRRLAGAGFQRAMAAGLRLVARTCDKWAAAIEQAILDGAPDAEQQGAELHSAIVTMHGDPNTRSAAGEHMRQLGRSRSNAVAAMAKTQLSAWAAQHVANGRAAEQRRDDKTAAEELEQASLCDAALTQEAYDAAMMHERAGQPGRAVRIYRRLLLSATGILVERSAERLQALWESSKAALPSVKFVPRNDWKASDWHRSLDEVSGALPALDSADVVALHEQVDQGNTREVARRLQELLDALGKTAPHVPTMTDQPAGPPRLGADFKLPGASIPCRWVPGKGDEPGFWHLSSVVTADLWCAVLDNEKTPTRNAPDGEPGGEYVKRSWDSARLLCSKLTTIERDAGRLPAGYVYALPSKARLEQLRDSTGRLPGPPGLSLWTTDAEGFDRSVDQPFRLTCSCDPGGLVTAKACWQNHPRVALMIVLVREH